MILEKICVGDFAVNCYILGSARNKKAIIIDPGADFKKIKGILEKKKLTPVCIVNTHAHIDHIGADKAFRLPVYIHKEDVALLRDPALNLSKFFAAPFTVESNIEELCDNQDIFLDQLCLKVIHTPGHTPGGISLLLLNGPKKILFSGDTLFFCGVGRTDLPLASESQLRKSIKQRLFVLDEDTLVYPGHGPQTTIGGEKRNNPFLSDS